MTPARKSTTPGKKNVTTIRGDVVDSVVVTGDNNQTIIQKFFNIFKSDAETLEQRKRRIFMIFLRRVDGGYIFIHRLLMKHFAEMYVESPTSKGN